jgi:hypothetical protein
MHDGSIRCLFRRGERAPSLRRLFVGDDLQSSLSAPAFRKRIVERLTLFCMHSKPDIEPTNGQGDHRTKKLSGGNQNRRMKNAQRRFA